VVFKLASKVKEKIIQLFTENDNKYLSGQFLSDELGISRTAIWKYMKELQEEGIEVEAVRKVGYKIIGKSDRMTPTDIQLGLETKKFGRNIFYQEETNSTQTIANELVLNGAEEGTIVLAERQLIGRGRLQRSWVTSGGKAIAMSLILRPSISPKVAPQLTLLTAVAIACAIEKVTGLQPNIKWPNDILINKRKVCGILTEMQGDADCIKSVVIGIGINVNQVEEDYPMELADIATSLRIEKGQTFMRAKLIQVILAEFEKYYAIFLEKGFKPIKILWESYAISLGKQIRATTLTEEIVGNAIGITDEGQLLIEDHLGEIHTIYSADISINK
jgi:BirA family transcriptional regulator, biotin operon repressor / biotin---[acetyl-CoA-carboxylase] ligase